MSIAVFVIAFLASVTGYLLFSRFQDSSLLYDLSSLPEYLPSDGSDTFYQTRSNRYGLPALMLQHL